MNIFLFLSFFFFENILESCYVVNQPWRLQIKYGEGYMGLEIRAQGQGTYIGGAPNFKVIGFLHMFFVLFLDTKIQLFVCQHLFQ